MSETGKQMLAQLRRGAAPAPRVIAQLFVAHGIERIYACPGDLCFGLLGACHEAGIHVVTCRTHATAIFAAAAEAQAIGALRCLVVVTRGPGVQNAMAAMSSTVMNGTPVVLVAPSEDAGVDRTGAFQAWAQGWTAPTSFWCARSVTPPQPVPGSRRRWRPARGPHAARR